MEKKGTACSIDFKKLYEEEKLLSKQKLAIKSSSIINVYNML